jgi:hypothetical protein
MLMLIKHTLLLSIYIYNNEQSRINTKVTDREAAEFDSSITLQPAVGHNFEAV